MMLLLFPYDVRSERELVDTIPMRLDWLWFLGFDLNDEIPIPGPVRRSNQVDVARRRGAVFESNGHVGYNHLGAQLETQTDHCIQILAEMSIGNGHAMIVLTHLLVQEHLHPTPGGRAMAFAL